MKQKSFILIYKNIIYFYIMCVFRILYPCDINLENLSFISLQELLQERSDISYTKYYDAQPFWYKKLEISPFSCISQPRRGCFNELFIVKIPKGIATTRSGWIFVDNNIIQDFLPQYHPLTEQIIFFKEKLQEKNISKKVHGKVAVITTSFPHVYGHWFADIVPRLEFLLQTGIEFDWLYAPIDQPYMIDTYKLLEIPLEKIIDIKEVNIIQADELIVPALPTRRLPCNTDPVRDCYNAGVVWPKLLLDKVRSRLLTIAQGVKKDYSFAKKIFISRKNNTFRKVLNEDEVFANFEKLGFVRYETEKLSLIEQILLFNGAEIIVSPHGSGLTNLIFTQPGTKVIEIFQNQFDSSFSNLAQDMNCQYIPLKTMEQDVQKSTFISTYISIDTIKSFIKNNQEFLSSH